MKTKTKRIRKAFPKTNRNIKARSTCNATTYNPIYFPPIAYSALKNTGCDNIILGDLFGVGPNTIKTWCYNYPEFKSAVLMGRDEYDSEVVEKKLVCKALGYDYEEETWERKVTGYKEDDDGKLDKSQPIYEMILTKIEKKQKAPDTTSIIFWLVNREKDRWAHVNKIVKEHQFPDGVPVINNNTQFNIQAVLADASPEELQMLSNLAEKNQILEIEDNSGSPSAKH